MNHSARFATIAFCLLLFSNALAHPGHEHHDHESDAKSLRTWTDDTGFFQVQGTFVMANDGKVQVRKQDDTLSTLPIGRLSEKDQAWIENRLAELDKLNTQVPKLVVAQVDTRDTSRQTESRNAPPILKNFEPFSAKLKFRWDDDCFYVESNGMPDHQMMVGITAWQQQVPLSQNYTGDNAWRIPLHPVPAKKPMSAKTNFFRGAIALAVNGVPILNPIKNDGRTDTLLAGELDQWGGHCGRADDYHYHIAPVHLEKQVGKGNPVAYALDGYPILGYEEVDGSQVNGLDWLNGHKDAEGHYHYHATKTYPYLNGGFYGQVVERDGQVDPQPRAQGVRPYMPPLRGARITGFTSPKPNNYSLQYELRGEKRYVNYTVAEDRSATFKFVDASGTKTETYQPRVRGGGRPDVGQRDNRPRPDNPPPRNDDRRPPGDGGGNPLQRALDANRDGTISAEELENAPAAIRLLDRNRDGKIDRSELGYAGGEKGGQLGPQAGETRGTQPGEGPRQPWILIHAKEIDANEDGIISRDEIVGEATRSFAGYDKDEDGKLTGAEYGSRSSNVRSAMGGFMRSHAKELDRDGDSVLSKQEVVGNAERMFAKVDTNNDGKITNDELEASRRPE